MVLTAHHTPSAGSLEYAVRAMPPPSPPSPLTRRCLKGYYLLSFAGLGSLFPFLPPILSARGLSAVEISWILVVLPLTLLIGLMVIWFMAPFKF